MITHELQQGTPEWHQFRAQHLTASDAPAMLGLSPYKSRSELLREKATGITKDIDAATQRRFDDGHRFEALARPLAEQIIGQELYPAIGSEGKLAASFDGITIDETVCWEHKTANAELLDSLKNKVIPEHYHPQIEQQLMLSGAERCLFSATKWDGDVLVADAHCWYTPNAELRSRILQGWTQFAIDLENYQHVEHAEKPKAEVTIELPALFVHAKGEITTHNMDEFGHKLTAKLAEVRAIALVTDQDFSNAKEAAKKFRDTAKAIAMSKEQMLAQAETIGEAARKMDAWAKDLNATALQLEKDVEREDLAKKRVMVGDTAALYAAHIEALEAETRPIRLNIPAPVFAEAIKGKSKYASMQGALDDMLANAKIAADAIAKDIREKLTWCKDNAAGMSFLFPDLQQIITKPTDDFTLLIQSRIKEHNEAEARKEAAIRAKAEADAAAKLEAERAQMQAEEETKAREKMEAERRAAEEARIHNELEAAYAKDPNVAHVTQHDPVAEADARNNPPQSEAGTLAGAQPEPAAPVAKPGNVVVIEHQDEIGAFLASRDFGKEVGKVRAILVEFIKFSAQFGSKKVA